MFVTDPVLAEALRHSSNKALTLLYWLAGERGIQLIPSNPKKNGVVCDIRPGHEEKNPSLSFSDTPVGAVFKRHGDDDFGGGAVDFVAECLGIARKEAAAELIKRAGLSEKLKAGSIGKRPKGKPKRSQRSAASASPSPALPTEPVKPLPSADDIRQHMASWEDFDPVRHEAAADHLKKRGLLEAAQSGLLVVKVQHDKFAFGITDPHDQLVTFKSRVLSSKEKPRYMYVILEQGSPAWCSPQLAANEREIWIEGELNGAALAAVLKGTDIGVQGIAGASAQPHVSHLRGSKKVVYIYADPDEAGDKARLKWKELALELNQTVILLPRTAFYLSGAEGKTDACDVLGQCGTEELLNRLHTAMAALEEVTLMLDDTGFAISKNQIFQLKRDPRTATTSRSVIADFVAFIDEQQTRIEATEAVVTYRMIGRTSKNLPLPQITVPVADFGSATALKKQWGAATTIIGRKWEAVSTAIELFSKLRQIRKTKVFTHTGWHKHEQAGWVFLSNGSVIGKQGVVHDILVELPESLKRVALPAPPQGSEAITACRHSLALVDLVPSHVGIPALGALYRSPLGTMNATIVLYGGTGRRKTTFLALLMAHFGSEFDLNRPMTGWNSTANFILLLLHAAKDILALIDDYKPHAMSKREGDRVEGGFGQTIQAVADGGGKGTLTVDRRERAIVYPRGTLMTSAEDVPSGQSNQARCVLIHVDEDLLGPQQERSQAYREAANYAQQGGYSAAMSGYIQYLAQHDDEVRVGSELHRQHVQQLAPYFPGAHGRNGEAAAELSFGWRVYLSYAVQIGAITLFQAQQKWEAVCSGLLSVIGQQGALHELQNPLERMISDLQTLLTQKKVYLKDVDTGEYPIEPESAGWQKVHFGEDGRWEVPPQAQHVGWLNEEANGRWVYLIPNATYAVLNQFAHQQGRTLPSETALWTMLRDRFYPEGLMRCDESGKRNTKKVNIRCEGFASRCLVLAFPLHSLFGGNDGNSGNEVIKTSSETANPPFPPLALLGGVSGNSGNDDVLTGLLNIHELEEDPTLDYVDI